MRIFKTDMPLGRQTPAENERLPLCDFSRGGLDARLMRSHPNLAPRPQRGSLSFSAGCFFARAGRRFKYPLLGNAVEEDRLKPQIPNLSRNRKSPLLYCNLRL